VHYLDVGQEQQAGRLCCCSVDVSANMLAISKFQLVMLLGSLSVCNCVCKRVQDTQPCRTHSLQEMQSAQHLPILLHLRVGLTWRTYTHAARNAHALSQHLSIAITCVITCHLSCRSRFDEVLGDSPVLSRHHANIMPFKL
jgi:hypothetical protein